MKKVEPKQLLVFVLLAVSTLTTFITSKITEAEEGPAGEVVYAVNSSAFNQKGGDPATSSGGASFSAQTVFEHLVVNDYTLQDLPALAKSWKIAENWSHIDIFLRDDIHDIKFHNGDPVTAEDVKYSLETYLRIELRWLFAPIYKRQVKKIEIVNPHQIRVHLNGPLLKFLGRMTLCNGIFPKKYREEVGDDGFADKPIGAGPFKWVDYKQDQWLKVKAVKTHYRKVPEIKSLKFIYAPNASTRLAMLKAGEVDIAELISPQIPQVESDPNLRVVLGKYRQGFVLAYADLAKRKGPSPFYDIRVRKAASLAIDRKTICDKILFGNAEPYGEVLSPVTLGYDSSIKPDPYDPETAKALLTEAGYADGFTTKLCGTPGSRYLLEALQSQLEEVVIKTELDIYEGGAWFWAFKIKRLRGLITAQSFYYAIREGPTNLNNFYVKGMPFCYVTTPEISAAVIKGNSAITDEDLASAAREVSKLIRESRINLHLWANHVAWGLGPRIEYYQPKTGGNMVQTFEYIRLKR
jgi:peptide/nickel transport system substrate-binding protein